MYTVTADKSLVDHDGKVVFFSTQRFVEDIVLGECCFICGAYPHETVFNDEHIMPDWILRRYQLHDKAVTLPNDVTLRYDRYKIPCCQKCNTQLGDQLETPVRALIDAGYEALCEHIENEGPRLLFVWLTLIFLKTHLKDTELHQQLDRRKGDDKIADAYRWEDLHHLHCVARSYYSGSTLEESTYGSIFVWPAKQAPHFPSFDFRDLYASQSILLRVGDIAIIAVLNDACASICAIQSTLKRLEGPLSPIQLRELLAHCAYINLNLKERPSFYTNVQAALGRCEIRSRCPTQVSLTDHEAIPLGELVYGCCQDVLAFYKCADDGDSIKRGAWTSLFRPDGTFLADSMDNLLAK